MLVKKNIWTIYLAFVVASLVLAAVIINHRWHSLLNTYLAQQAHRAEQVADAFNAILISQEMLLDVLGQRLVKSSHPVSEVESLELFDDLRELNPAVMGFGLARPDGQIILASRNIPADKLPDLMANDFTRDGFRQALASPHMVLGRTYMLNHEQSWGIPIRKALRNEADEVIGVMTSALHIRGDQRLFDQALHYSELDSVELIRGRDHFLQYRSSEQNMPETIYRQPLDEDYINDFYSAMMAAADTDLYTIRHRPQALSFQLGKGEQHYIAAAKYNARFDFWTVSRVSCKALWGEFIPVLLSLTLIFFIIQWMTFFLFRSIAKAEAKQRQALEHQARHDALTRLPNRYFLIEHVQQLLTKGVDQFSLLFIDIDNFKGINDNFGHDCGDEVLVELALRLKESISANEILVRLGGDEFIIVSPQADSHRLQQRCEKLVYDVSRSYHVRSMSFHLGCSVGIAHYPQHGATLNELQRAADIAMYQAKKQKNSICFFRPELQAAYLYSIQIEQALRFAANRHELYMMYQPQVDFHGRLLGVEALVRWQHGELGLVPPNEFIPVAEASGLMDDLGDFIIRTTLREMAALKRELKRQFDVSINISVHQFLQQEFVEKILADIHRFGFKPQEVTLEITENVFIEDMALVEERVAWLKREGVRMSLDDFGTGYSSLSVLRRLPMDELKIDKSFVDHIGDDPAAQKMIQSIITIGKNCGMETIAEGVESASQVQLLNQYGCERYQGYWFAKPLTARALRNFVKESGCCELDALS